MNNNVRKITEGAVMIALIGMVLVLNRQLAGMLELYFLWLMPIPIAVYTVKYGWKNAVVACVSVLFLSFIISTLSSVFYVGASCLCGAVYGEGVRRKKGNLRLLLITMVVALIAEIVPIFFLAGIFGYDLATDVLMAKEMCMEMVASMGFDQSVHSLFAVILDKILPSLIVAMAVFNAALEGIIIHLLTSYTLKRLKFEVQKMKPVIEIEIPKWLGYVSLLAIVAAIVSMREDASQTLVKACSFFGAIGVMVLAFAGYIVVLLFAARKKKKHMMFLILLVMILLFPYSLLYLVLMGFLYITTDMRQRMMKLREGGESNGR